MRVRDLFEADDADHYAAMRETGFWGRQGAGCIMLARDTGRILLPFRAKLWNASWGRFEPEQPHTWGTWGGAMDGSDPAATVRQEVYEEAGYQGHLDLIPLFVFTAPNGNFRYHNFLAVVDHEFDPELNWETESYRWFEFGDWPSPLHFGLQSLLNDPPSIARIETEVQEIKQALQT